MNQNKPLISLRIYLERIKSDHTREAISKKLKRIISLGTPETEGSTVDTYRILGKATIQLQLIIELNKFVMDNVSCYSSMITPWAKELWEYREHYMALVDLSTKMSKALIFKDQFDGLYTPQQEAL